MSAEREAILRDFVAAAGWAAAELVPLAGDASARRYVRLVGAAGSAVLMDAPPERGLATGPFEAMARTLAVFGLSAPAILAWDEANGLMLMEDFGDDLLARTCAADPGREAELYVAAVETLVALQRHPAPPGLAPYAHDDMAGRAALSVSWYLPGTGAAPDPAAAAAIAAEVARLLALHATGHDVVALRDYHAENLVWLPQRQGVRRIGLLDFQDAMAGHPVYDLVSLIEDARRDVLPGTRDAATACWLDAGAMEPERFAAAAAVLAAQRNLRILGVFARLCLHWGKPHYLELMPRVWGHLSRDLEHPDLARLSGLVRDTLPPPAPELMQRMREECGRWPMR